MGDREPNEGIVLAVDAGGTSCRTAVTDLRGNCLGIGLAGSANPLSTADEDAAAAVVQSIVSALEAGNAHPSAVGLVLVAAAGGGHRPEFIRVLEQSLAREGVTAPLVLGADGMAAFCSGTHEDHGYVLVAGTGAVALRVEGGRNVRSVDGLGWLLGDVGSGFWLGQRVVRAVLAELDGTGQATALTPLLVEAMDLQHMVGIADGDNGRPRLVHEIGIRAYTQLPVRLARFASLAFAADGDPVAEAILQEAATGLAVTLRAAMVPAVTGPVVVSGGLLATDSGLRPRLAAALLAHGVEAELVPVVDGLVGACVLALRRFPTPVDRAVFDRITATVAAHRP